ncbi:PAS domain S-box-containing protein [Rhizobium sp. PP-F2F-G38]|nr:PAS domain S-box-containing protein [Rhizobium sp. PP-WC-1G-195]PYF00748.1 PAS domain S-box-containing protein [Rhizobium sp. PP-F2F-G38]
MNDVTEHQRIEAQIVRKDLGPDPFAAAVRSTRMPMIITDPSKPDNPIVFANDAFLRFTGYERDEVINTNCRFLQGPDTDRGDIQKVREAIANRHPIEIDVVNYKKSGEPFWNRLLISPVFNEKGELTYFFASQLDVTLERDRLVRLERDRDLLEGEVQKRTAELKRNETQLRFAMEAGHLGYWTLKIATMELIASPDCKANFGYAPDQDFTVDNLLDAVLPEDQARVRDAFRKAVERHEEYDVEHRCVLPDGRLRWVHVRGLVYYEADGHASQMSGLSMDITDRKRTEEARAITVRELSHRMKNLMTTVQSVINQTLRQAPDKETAGKAITSRLQSIGAAQDLLVSGNFSGADLGRIIRATLDPFWDSYPNRIDIDGPDLQISSNLVLTLAMALHELATNAIKYGALSNLSGRIRIRWHAMPDASLHRLKLTWEESGGPPVSPPTSRGFGTRMIERVLSNSLGGSAELRYDVTGVVFTMEAPIGDEDEDGEGMRLG